ncbi:hypothetical protein SAMN05216215_100338 [Saccharopolyspora shandongensis]|uniref:Uncharacterized protein n=1 Tax=Saccharopolyspora shandongensis TaxID=418495 RepID=A0A1H2TAL3_9PSEU|nr:hypothetical protein [Saccharopolyspora shandongensis]SDW40735.1 hypothetical protein SAMN05216215_100338 [Saccharopolyspora shandongensis]
MILMGFLANAPWPVGLAAAMLLALAIERSRRKTYKSVLSTAPDGTLLIDKSRRGRALIIVRVPDSRLGEGLVAEAERDACRR